MGNLTHEEIRFVQTKISSERLRSDPVDKLPFEICYQIFQHLETYQIFQAQRVSRKWFDLLSSPEIVKPLTLTPWFGNSEMPSRIPECFLQGALKSPSGLSSNDKASLQAKHIDSFRNGTAHSMATGKWPAQGGYNEMLCRIDFAGSVLAWVDRYPGCIRLKCLISGQSVSLFTPTREEIRQIAISDTTIVAMSHAGKCCAWDLSSGIRDLEGQAPECIETNVGEPQIMFVSGGTVVALYHGSDETMSFTTWDTKDRQLYKFRMQITQGKSIGMYNYFVIVTSGGKSVVFFERVFDKTNYVRFTRTNLEGRIESSGCIEHPDIGSYSMHSENAMPVCTTGCVTLWSYSGSRAVLNTQLQNTNTWEIMRIIYDTNADRLEVHRHAVEHSIPRNLCAGDFLWWKDVAFFGTLSVGPGELAVLDLKAAICKKADMSDSALIQGSLRYWENDNVVGTSEPFLAHEFLLGNESFLISFW